LQEKKKKMILQKLKRAILVPRMVVEEGDNLEEGSRGVPSRFYPMAKKKTILKKNISTPGFLL